MTVPAKLRAALRSDAARATTVTAAVTTAACGTFLLAYIAGTVPPAGARHDITLLLASALPGFLGQATAMAAGLRSRLLWALHLPGLTLWTVRPLPLPEGWSRAWAFDGMPARISSAVLYSEHTPVAEFISLGCAMAAVVLAGAVVRGTVRGIGLRMRDSALEAADDDGSPEGGGAGRLPRATWAAAADVRERFSHPGGIVLGEMTDPVGDTPGFDAPRRETWGRQGKGRLITLDPEDGNGHVLVTTQASGFKTTGLVIPNVLEYRGPLLVFDPKCEIHARCADARREMGFEPVRIDADNGFDPAKLIALLARDRDSVWRRMAQMLIPKSLGTSDTAEYFRSAGIALLSALLAHHARDGSRNILGTVAHILGKAPQEVYSTVVNSEVFADAPAFIVNQISGLQGIDPRFWHSVRTEITNQIVFAEFPDVASYIGMDAGSPLLEQAIDPRCDLFLNIPQHICEDFAPMLRAMFGSFLLAAQLTEVNEAPRARRLILVDEAAKLGSLDILENIRDRGRSVGLHLMLFYQTIGEVEKLWGRPGLTSWRDGCSAVVTGPVTSRESAQDLSTMLGTRTVRVTTGSSSSSAPVLSPMAGTTSASESEQLRDIPLLSPTAISQLPRHASIITAAGSKPILASKAVWFTRADMRGRVHDTDRIMEGLDVLQAQRRLASLVRDGAEGEREDIGSDDGETRDSPPDDGREPPPEHPDAPAKGGDGHPGNTGGTDDADVAGSAVGESATAGDDADGQPPAAPDDPGEWEYGPAEPGYSHDGYDDGDWTEDPEGEASGQRLPVPAPPRPGSEADATPPVPEPPTEGERTLCETHGWDPDLYAVWGRIGVEFRRLEFGRRPGRMHLPRPLDRLRRGWDRWMAPPRNIPLNLRPFTAEIIPHPREARDGHPLLRLWDRIDWCLSHPADRYRVYDSKLRTRAESRFAWGRQRLHAALRGVPPGPPPWLDDGSLHR